MMYFFQIDARELEEDEYVYQMANLNFCLNKLGYVDKTKGY